MDFKIKTESGRGQMTFEKADNIMNNIYLSLNVEKRSFFLNTSFSSRFHELKKLTDDTPALAKEYCKQSLQWLIDTGRAKKEIAIDTEIDKTENINRLKMHIKAIQANEKQVEFEVFKEIV